jgi:plastocyanin
MKPGRLRLIAALVACCAMAVPADAATIQIVMQNLDISPAEVSAKVGDTIEWTNNDIVAHTATARNGDFDVVLPPNKTASLVLKNRLPLPSQHEGSAQDRTVVYWAAD